MQGLAVLEVMIGLLFIYTLLSLVCSAVNEIFAQFAGLRARNLLHAIERLIPEKALRERFLDHALIRSLSSGPDKRTRSMPSYIPAHMFALVLVDIIVRAGSDRRAVAEAAELRERVLKLDTVAMRDAMLPLIDLAAGEFPIIQDNLARWFTDTMDRASGWYKRRTQRLLTGVALVTVVGLNIDTFAIAKTLWSDHTLREQIVARAGAYVEGEKAAGRAAKPPDGAVDTLHAVGLDTLDMPMGWADNTTPKTPLLWLAKLVGLLITTLAVSLGAPFWFDLLNRLASVRGTGKRPPRKS